MNTQIGIYVAAVGVAIFLTLIRLVKGPDAQNRTVTLDVLTTIFAALFVVFAFISKRVIYLDVALVYAIVAFVGVLVIARFLERRL